VGNRQSNFFGNILKTRYWTTRSRLGDGMYGRQQD